MDFRYSTEQDDFRASLNGFLRDAAPPAMIRGAANTTPALEADVQRAGAAGVARSARIRRCGWHLLEAAVAFSELGRALTPVPLAATTFAVEAVFRTGDEEQRRRLLKGMLCGDQVGALAVAAHGDTDPATARVRAEWQGGTVLTGVCGPVLHGSVADLFIVPAVADGVVALHVVAADAPG